MSKATKYGVAPAMTPLSRITGGGTQPQCPAPKSMPRILPKKIVPGWRKK
jgi:hypothetical protein